MGPKLNFIYTNSTQNDPNVKLNIDLKMLINLRNLLIIASLLLNNYENDKK